MNALVLLVDDFEDARDIYSSYLMFRGLRVVCAEDGWRALECARSDRPDIILMDLRMPGLSGTEVMRRLRDDATFSDVPIVALTAHALEDEQMLALRSGFDGVISKPCLPDELFQEIVSVLAKWRPDLASP
jgi:two-component system cell cycle response regulator DivK